jgi:catechol 2,3-dioxygenase-like lactoylglutathione lyase family enzyme
VNSAELAPLTGILETVLYCTSDNEEATRIFYEQVLGLRRIGGSSYRVGGDVFLLFNADRSAVQDEPPPHGATGSVHVCFLTSSDVYEAWKMKVASSGIEIIQELTWDESGFRSFYFHDPAGNTLEIADGDLWPP